MRDFRKLNIWSEAIEFAVSIYAITSKFPDHEKFGLRSQLNRASVSIPSNIAEGSRGSDKEFKQFLNIALGSSFEVETQLILANRIGYITDELSKEYIDRLNILQKRINAFRSTL